MANPHEDGWEDDGYSSISGATLEKACKELGEDPSTRGQAVKDFREMILTKQKVRVTLLIDCVILWLVMFLVVGEGVTPNSPQIDLRVVTT